MLLNLQYRMHSVIVRMSWQLSSLMCLGTVKSAMKVVCRVVGIIAYWLCIVFHLLIKLGHSDLCQCTTCYMYWSTEVCTMQHATA